VEARFEGGQGAEEAVAPYMDGWMNEESEGLWNIRNSDYNDNIKSDDAMLKLMGALLKRNVAVESVEVMRKKLKSIKNV
jgi:hypothetical protein